jgi:hypothetical protein
MNALIPDAVLEGSGNENDAAAHQANLALCLVEFLMARPILHLTGPYFARCSGSMSKRMCWAKNTVRLECSTEYINSIAVGGAHSG